jgi:hypothetical protein
MEHTLRPPQPQAQGPIPSHHDPSHKTEESGRCARRNSPRYSPRGSASSFRRSLQRNSGRNLDGNMDWDSGLTLGRVCGCYSARNRTKNSTRCSRSSGGSNGQSSRRSSPRRSWPCSSGRNFGSHKDSYGGGIGGVGKGRGARGLEIVKLGQGLAGRAECCILHNWA